MFKKTIFAAVVFAMGLSGWTAVSHAAQTTDFHMEPNLVHIGAAYNGTQVSLSGEIPQDADVLVRISDKKEDGRVLEKGRVFGILWMNTNTLTFHNIPKIYLIYCPPAIKKSDLSDNPKWRSLGIGFDALKSQASMTPEEEDMDRQFEEFLKLKTHEGLYKVNENAVTYHDEGEGLRSFKADLAIPCAVPPGSYMVTTFVLKDGMILNKDEQQLKIQEAGLPAAIGFLAFNHGVLYGVLSVLFAIGAGFITGLFFKKSGAH